MIIVFLWLNIFVSDTSGNWRSSVGKCFFFCWEGHFCTYISSHHITMYPYIRSADYSACFGRWKRRNEKNTSMIIMKINRSRTCHKYLYIGGKMEDILFITYIQYICHTPYFTVTCLIIDRCD